MPSCLCLLSYLHTLCLCRYFVEEPNQEKPPVMTDGLHCLDFRIGTLNEQTKIALNRFEHTTLCILAETREASKKKQQDKSAVYEYYSDAESMKTSTEQNLTLLEWKFLEFLKTGAMRDHLFPEQAKTRSQEYQDQKNLRERLTEIFKEIDDELYRKWFKGTISTKFDEVNAKNCQWPSQIFSHGTGITILIYNSKNHTYRILKLGHQHMGNCGYTDDFHDAGYGVNIDGIWKKYHGAVQTLSEKTLGFYSGNFVGGGDHKCTKNYEISLYLSKAEPWPTNDAGDDLTISLGDKDNKECVSVKPHGELVRAAVHSNILQELSDLKKQDRHREALKPPSSKIQASLHVASISTIQLHTREQEKN